MYGATYNKSEVITPSDTANVLATIEKPVTDAAVASTAVDLTTNVLTKAAHGMLDGDVIRFTVLGTVTGISLATDYYVRDKTTDTFKVSATFGAAAVDLTGANTTPPTYQRTIQLVTTCLPFYIQVLSDGDVNALPFGHRDTNSATEKSLGAQLLSNCKAGTILPGLFKKVFETNTTAAIKLKAIYDL